MSDDKARRAQRFAADFAAATERRKLLTTRPHAFRQRDYAVALDGRFRLAAVAAPVEIRIHYVPDRLVLNIESFEPYLAGLEAQPWTGLEEATTALVGDLANEVVPRWIHLWAATKLRPADADRSLVVTMEERQPGWDNEELLSRLGKI